MPWRLVEVPEDNAVESDLTDSELIVVSIILAQYSEPDDVYRRAWQKIQAQTDKAISAENRPYCESELAYFAALADLERARIEIYKAQIQAFMIRDQLNPQEPRDAP